MTYLPKELRQLIISYLPNGQVLAWLLETFLLKQQHFGLTGGGKMIYVADSVNAILAKHGLKSHLLAVNSKEMKLMLVKDQTEFVPLALLADVVTWLQEYVSARTAFKVENRFYQTQQINIAAWANYHFINNQVNLRVVAVSNHLSNSKLSHQFVCIK